MRSITNSCLKKKLKICEKVLAKVVSLGDEKDNLFSVQTKYFCSTDVPS